VGDSVYSPYYWSNRVVETLGRGGFLIHQDVPGLKEEFPFLVTYTKGDIVELKDLVEYYLVHEEERQDILKKNFEWVRERYTMKHKCQEILNIISPLISSTSGSSE
jgi:spore maturation protein CgeB